MNFDQIGLVVTDFTARVLVDIPLDNGQNDQYDATIAL